MKGVTGYHNIGATDGEIGHVEDFISEDENEELLLLHGI
jgi:hypothetical protein